MNTFKEELLSTFIYKPRKYCNISFAKIFLKLHIQNLTYKNFEAISIKFALLSFVRQSYCTR